MNQDQITDLYRAHANARLRRDQDEARRIADEAGIAPELRMTHLIFTFSLFGQVILDHFGDELDRNALAAFTKQLWHKHKGDHRFHPLEAEALIRAVYGETHFLTEIAQNNQSHYLWSIMEELVDPASSEADLDERFDAADQLGREWLAEALESPTFARWRPDRPTPTPDRPAVPTPDRRAVPAPGEANAEPADPAESAPVGEEAPSGEGTVP